MSNTDVRVLFPDREKKKRTRRGQRPTRWLNAPSYDDMIKVAFNPTVSDIQTYGRSKITFYFLQKEVEDKNLFGYLKIVEDSLYPNTIDSYTMLQAVYNDLLQTPDWHDTVEDLIKVRSTKPTARVKNVDFMIKVKRLFNLPEAPIGVEDSVPPKHSDPETPPIEFIPDALRRDLGYRPRPPRVARAVRPARPVQQVVDVVEPINDAPRPIEQPVFVVDGIGRAVQQEDLNAVRQVFMDAEAVYRVPVDEQEDVAAAAAAYDNYWLDEIQF